MTVDNDDILDPAHQDDGGIENAGAAGIPAGGADKTGDNADEFKVTEDGNVAEHRGVKYIRHEALASAREENKKLKEALGVLEPVMPEFEEFLKTKQNRRAATQDAVIRSGGEGDDPEYLDEVATALGFYDEQNQPDRRRAQAHLNITRRESQRVTERAVDPVLRGTMSDRARVNRERASGAKFVDGRPVADKKYIDAALDSLDERFVADPNVANMAQVIAAGLEYLDMRRNGTLRPGRRGSEPMYLEHGSNRLDADHGEMSALDLAAARARGKTPDQWAKLNKAANKASTLEDI